MKRLWHWVTQQLAAMKINAAIGTVSNVASRLCDEAKPGQILISPRVLMAVKDAVRSSR
jgi:class 3 adenylate cyclase